LLYHAGTSPDGVVENMRRFDIDPSSIEAIVCGHGHFDHTTGIDGPIRTLGRTNLPVLIHPAFGTVAAWCCPVANWWNTYDQPPSAGAGGFRRHRRAATVGHEGLGVVARPTLVRSVLSAGAPWTPQWFSRGLRDELAERPLLGAGRGSLTLVPSLALWLTRCFMSWMDTSR
jgi:hypothetical protein